MVLPTQLPVAVDPGLNPSGPPEHLVNLLSEDEVLHHRYLSCTAESFDAWSIHAYRFGGDVVYAIQPLSAAGEAVVTAIPEDEFQVIAETALDAYSRSGPPRV